MPYTVEQLEALRRALATGERRVSFADKTVEYRTVDELKEALRVVERGLADDAAAAGVTPRAPRQIRLTSRKGL